MAFTLPNFSVYANSLFSTVYNYSLFCCYESLFKCYCGCTIVYIKQSCFFIASLLIIKLLSTLISESSKLIFMTYSLYNKAENTYYYYYYYSYCLLLSSLFIAVLLIFFFFNKCIQLNNCYETFYGENIFSLYLCIIDCFIY